MHHHGIARPFKRLLIPILTKQENWWQCVVLRTAAHTHLLTSSGGLTRVVQRHRFRHPLASSPATTESTRGGRDKPKQPPCSKARLVTSPMGRLSPIGDGRQHRADRPAMDHSYLPAAERPWVRVAAIVQLAVNPQQQVQSPRDPFARTPIGVRHVLNKHPRLAGPVGRSVGDAPGCPLEGRSLVRPTRPALRAVCRCGAESNWCRRLSADGGRDAESATNLLLRLQRLSGRVRSDRDHRSQGGGLHDRAQRRRDRLTAK